METAVCSTQHIPFHMPPACPAQIQMTCWRPDKKHSDLGQEAGAQAKARHIGGEKAGLKQGRRDRLCRRAVMSIESGWSGLLCCLQLRRLRSTSARPDQPTVEADPTSGHGTSPRSHFGRSPMPGGEQAAPACGIFPACKRDISLSFSLSLFLGPK